MVDIEKKETYLADMERVRKLVAPDWVRRTRERGVEAFERIPVPHRKMETWRLTNVAPITNSPYTHAMEGALAQPSAEAVAPWLYNEDAWTELVFVNGRYRAELSRTPVLPGGVTVTSLAEALERDHPATRAHLDQYLFTDDNIFAALNTALIEDGAFVQLADGLTLEQPIHLVFLSSPQDARSASYCRNLVVMGSASEACILESYGALTTDIDYLTNSVTEIALGAGAKLSHYRDIRESDAGNHLASIRVRQEAESTYAGFGFALSGAIVRNEIGIHLAGAGAACQLHGLYAGSDARLVDNALFVDHAAPQCRSRIAYKGVLDDSSKAVFTGKVLVRKGAQQTDSNQLNNTLLLSDAATVDTKPQLEIFADDVKCTHGATVGQPPDEMIFYFRSRGIDEAQARGMLTYGFADDVVSHVELAPLRRRLEKVVYKRFSPR
jgi:Fe-S cluster assembly protein SufD